MGKQIKANRPKTKDEEMEELKSMLEFTNRQLEHLIWQVVGNPGMGIHGLKPMCMELKEEVHKINEWKNGMWKVDFKKLVTRRTILYIIKIIGLIIAIGSGSFGVNQLWEHFIK